jgi:hypothetical protein
MNQSHTFDPELHEAGSAASQGECSYHGPDGGGSGPCDGAAVVSFQDRDGRWQSGCARALEQLVEKGDVEPLGQGG